MLKQLTSLRRQVDQRLRSLPVVQSALDGTLDRTTYVRYLNDIAYQYAPHSPQVMCLAASRCVNTHPELAEYLLNHAAEERGHNEWAHADLRHLRVAEGRITATRAAPACAAMIGHAYYLAGHGNPVALYGWMYILEAVGADLGPDVANALKSRFRTSLQFVAGHSVADKRHTQELQNRIQRYVRRSEDKVDVAHAAEVSADLYVRMFEQIQD
jgi:pyrroloquinoline quinone (PQQ) biosynthesis protein C